MRTTAWPMNDAAGHVAGLASNTVARHAFCSVVNRDGSCFGQFDLDGADVRLLYPAATFG